MKKMCLILLVSFFMSSTVQADFSFKIDGVLAPNEITLGSSETITLDIQVDPGIIFNGGDFSIVVSNTHGSLDNQSVVFPAATIRSFMFGNWILEDDKDFAVPMSEVPAKIDAQTYYFTGGDLFWNAENNIGTEGPWGGGLVPLVSANSYPNLIEGLVFSYDGAADVEISLVVPQGLSKYEYDGTGFLTDIVSIAAIGQTLDTIIVHGISGDTIAPTAGGSVAGITTAGGTTHNFTVTYSDNVAVDVSSLDGADVLVTGPSSYSQAASFVSVDVAGDGTPRVATYQVPAPGGSWDETDNGTYNVTMQANQVSDTATTANFVAGASLGTFEVNISGTPGDTIVPTAGGSVAGITTAGGTTHNFTVTYSDNVAVDVSSLDGADVLVTGPSSYSQAASFVSVDVAGDGTPRVATYQVPAPGGSWDETDNGTYNVTMQANQVSDTAATANFVAGASLGTFEVNIPIDTGDDLTLTQAVVRAGRSRNSTDFILLSGGSLDLVEADLAGVAKIVVGLYTDVNADPNFSEQITYNPANLNRQKYTHRGSTGNITMLQLDLIKKTFSIMAKNVDLSGLGSPFTLRLEVGSEIFTAQADETVINGTKASIPLQLMAGMKDVLQLNRTPVFRSGAKGDSLILIGSILVKDSSVNLANEDILLSWGGFSYTMSAGDTQKMGSRSKFIHRKMDRATRESAIGAFDFDKGNFKITLKNIAIGDQGDPVDFGLAFGSFDQVIQVDLP